MALSCLALASPVGAVESRCFGTVNKGRIERSVKLPASGANFVAYSSLGVAAGRTYVHSKVEEIVAAAYAAVAASDPSLTFVYGETGWRSGGRMRPHRSHQNGLSVDFFVPVRNKDGRSVPLPTGVANRLGYSIEFDKDARYREYSIDFAAMAEHLYRLHLAAKAQDADIALVIFDPTYLPRLFAASRGPYLQEELPFMKGQSWVRHDEHYHVDFAIPCARNSG